jgi:hypothetical protein
MRIYENEASQLRQVYDWVSHFDKYWDEKLDALGDDLDQQKRRKKK